MWNKLYNAAVKVQNSRTISPFIDAGGVAAAILTKQGNIYVGVCIDTACTLGMCAERNAIANMITNGENQIDKVVAVMPDGRVGSPCGACREYMMQLDKNSGEIEILLDLEIKKTVRLKELVPDWWGYDGFREQSNKFQFVQPNPIHSQTLRDRAFGLFLWKGRMNAKIPACQVNYNSKEQAQCTKRKQAIII